LTSRPGREEIKVQDRGVAGSTNRDCTARRQGVNLDVSVTGCCLVVLVVLVVVLALDCEHLPALFDPAKRLSDNRHSETAFVTCGFT